MTVTKWLNLCFIFMLIYVFSLYLNVKHCHLNQTLYKPFLYSLKQTCSFLDSLKSVSFNKGFITLCNVNEYIQLLFPLCDNLINLSPYLHCDCLDQFRFVIASRTDYKPDYVVIMSKRFENIGASVTETGSHHITGLVILDALIWSRFVFWTQIQNPVNILIV